MSTQIKQLGFNNIKSMHCASNSSRQVVVPIAACSVETASAATSAAVTTASVISSHCSINHVGTGDRSSLSVALTEVVVTAIEVTTVTCSTFDGKCGGNNHYTALVWAVMLVVALLAAAVSTQVV